MKSTINVFFCFFFYINLPALGGPAPSKIPGKIAIKYYICANYCTLLFDLSLPLTCDLTSQCCAVLDMLCTPWWLVCFGPIGG